MLRITETRYEVMMDAFDRLHYLYDWNVQLQDRSPISSDKPEFCLNWWACGTKGTEDAKEFQRQMSIVIEMAEMLNNLDIRVDSHNDSIITNGEMRDHYLDVLTDIISGYHDPVNFVEHFLKYEPEDEPEDEDDEYDDEYCPSATHGDYSPSCPWNAPGMSIHDFI